MPEYRIDPNFVVPEPTPADHFWTLPDPGSPEARHAAITAALDEWREQGLIQQVRVTLAGPDVEGDDTGYPSGIWLEGWNDVSARQLPFGHPWPTKDSAIWPPLTSTPPAIAIDAATAGETAKTGSTRSAKARAGTASPESPSR